MIALKPIFVNNSLGKFFDSPFVKNFFICHRQQIMLYYLKIEKVWR